MYEIRLNKNQGTIQLRKIQKNITLVQVGRRGEQGDQGDPGTPGAPGQGVPVGGTTGQVLAKDSNTNYDTEWIDIPSAPVSSVFGRTGAVVAVAGDYTGSQVNNVPSGGIAATTVQAALNELDSEKATDASVVHIAGSELITGLKTFDNGLLVSSFAELLSGMGIDGSDGVGGAALRLVSYDGEILIDAPGEIRLRTDGGIPRLVANGVSIDVTGLKITSVADPDDSSDAANKGYVDAQIAIVEGGDVDSFNGRTGIVVPVSGDYTASMITNTPAGGISGVTVQTALNELDTEKANDNAVVHLTGDETIAGNKSFSASPTVPSVTYNQTTAPTAATDTAVQWTASGAGTKDGQAYEQGDVLLTSNVGGVSKTLLVLDWSAI